MDVQSQCKRPVALGNEMQHSLLRTTLNGLRLVGGLSLLMLLNACGGSGSAFSGTSEGSTGNPSPGAGSAGNGSSSSSSSGSSHSSSSSSTSSASSSGSQSGSSGGGSSGGSGAGAGNSNGGGAVQLVGFTVTGLGSGETLVMLLNGGAPRTVTEGGQDTKGTVFFFTQDGESLGLPYGTQYSITVGTQPVGENCTVANGNGTVAAGAGTVAAVTCTTGTTNASAAALRPAPLVPTAREGAVVWTDAAGNLWLFGGQGQGSAGAPQTLRDLWRYSSTGHTWALMSLAGSKIPPARSNAASWTDLTGTLWLFGGQTAGSEGPLLLGDLWKFEPATGAWTEVSADSVAGDESGEPIPPARMSGAYWVDPSGDLWLFGGYGLDGAGKLGPLDDLWVYSPSAQSWTAQLGSRVVAR